MSWNGSHQADHGNSQTSRRSSHQTGSNARTILRGLIAGFLVVILGGVMVWTFVGRESEHPASSTDKGEKAPRTISEVKAQIRTNAVDSAAKAAKKSFSELSDAEKLAAIRAKYGDNIPDNLKPTVYYLEHPPKREFKTPPRPSHIFKRSSERQIAEMIMVEPGSWMLLRPQFNARFDSDFAASLNETIEFDKDDTDFQRELKQAVIDTKAELAERVRKGETASEIMNQFSDDLYEMGQYRQDIEKMVREVRLDPKMTDADVEDCVKAANEMLAKKGIKPMSMPNMMFRQAALRIQAEKNKQKNNQ